MITLQSGRLRVELADPGEAPNTKFRFDRAGYITEIILDGSVRFCASEPHNLRHPHSGGRGLCSEYRFDASGEAAPGEYFPKFGVGLIRKEQEEPYLFHKSYKEVRPFPVEVRAENDTAVYITRPVSCLGYAIAAEKRITVSGSELTMEIKMTNTGEKSVDIQEYCHNFISIDGMAAGSDYRLDMPGIGDLGDRRLTDRRGAPSGLRGCGKGITFCEPALTATDFAVVTDQISHDVPFLWRLSHKGAMAYVEGEESFTPSQINIWAMDHMMCPEVFHSFSLKPGEIHSWKRKWRFEKEYED